MTSTPPLLARLNWYWPLQLGGWSVLALFDLAQAMQRAGDLSVVAVCVAGVATGLLVSDAWHRLLKRSPAWRHMGRIAAAVLLMGCFNTFVVYLAFRVFKPFGEVRGYAWLPYAVLFWSGVYAVWTVLYVAALSIRRARHAEAEALRLELHAKDIELRALQAQVNPHFFFNSLNSVRALIYENPERAALMIDQLAGLMRYALQSGHAETVPLAAELEAVEAYLAIEKIRFEERLRVSVHIEPGLEHVMVPPMSLQTLVENAVKHGVELSTTGSDVCIRAWRGEGMTLIEIANAGAIRRLGRSTQVGLANARKRLELAVGGGASLDLAEGGGWVRATLQLPIAA